VTSVCVTATPWLVGYGVVVLVEVGLGEGVEVDFREGIRFEDWDGAIMVDDGGRRKWCFGFFSLILRRRGRMSVNNDYGGDGIVV